MILRIIRGGKEVWQCKDSAELARFRGLARAFREAPERAARYLHVAHVAHGFYAGTNCLSALVPHVGTDVTLSFDVHNWYNSVRTDQVFDGLCLAGFDPRYAIAMAESLTPGGSNRMGLPCAPAAAALAGVSFDCDLCDYLDSSRLSVVYTRYVDDILVSFWERDSCKEIVECVSIALAAHGWKESRHKRRKMRAADGNRVILGLSLGATSIGPCRRIIRKCRAAVRNRPDSEQSKQLVRHLSNCMWSEADYLTPFSTNGVH